MLIPYCSIVATKFHHPTEYFGDLHHTEKITRVNLQGNRKLEEDLIRKEIWGNIDLKREWL